jgi:regulatory protein
MRQGRAVGRRLFLELCRRGVSRDIAEELLSSSEGDYDERAAVRELLARRYPSFDPASADSRERRRIVSWFQRRGFSLSAIFDSLRMTEDE